MKKWIALLTAIIFLFVVVNLYAGENVSQDSSKESGKGTGTAILAAIGVILLVGLILLLAGGAISTGVLASLKKKEKKKQEQVEEIVEEVARNVGDKPNVGVLARLYSLTPVQVEDEISLLVASGRISITRALAEEEVATAALEEMYQSLENRSRALGRFEQAGIHKLRELIKTHANNPRFFEEGYFQQVYQLLLICN